MPRMTPRPSSTSMLTTGLQDGAKRIALLCPDSVLPLLYIACGGLGCVGLHCLACLVLPCPALLQALFFSDDAVLLPSLSAMLSSAAPGCLAAQTCPALTCPSHLYPGLPCPALAIFAILPLLAMLSCPACALVHKD